MARLYRRRYGRRRTFRRRYGRRRFKRTRRYNGRRRRFSTSTKVIKFQVQLAIPLQDGQGYLPITFAPTQLPGFLDWQTTMSEFRILKAHAKIPINPGTTTEGALADQTSSYLRVSSRPITTTKALVAGTSSIVGLVNVPLGVALRANLDTLRQTKYSKQMFPNDIRNSLALSFYPYTFQWSGHVYTNGTDSTSAANTQYLEYRSGRRWMSMSFLGATQEAGDDVVFVGPYVAKLAASTPDVAQTTTTWVPSVLLTVYAQFRGQK